MLSHGREMGRGCSPHTSRVSVRMRLVQATLGFAYGAKVRTEDSWARTALGPLGRAGGRRVRTPMPAAVTMRSGRGRADRRSLCMYRNETGAHRAENARRRRRGKRVRSWTGDSFGRRRARYADAVNAAAGGKAFANSLKKTVASDHLRADNAPSSQPPGPLVRVGGWGTGVSSFFGMRERKKS